MCRPTTSKCVTERLRTSQAKAFTLQHGAPTIYGSQRRATTPCVRRLPIAPYPAVQLCRRPGDIAAVTYLHIVSSHRTAFRGRQHAANAARLRDAIRPPKSEQQGWSEWLRNGYVRAGKSGVRLVNVPTCSDGQHSLCRSVPFEIQRFACPSSRRADYPEFLVLPSSS